MHAQKQGDLRWTEYLERNHALMQSAKHHFMRREGATTNQQAILILLIPMKKTLPGQICVSGSCFQPRMICYFRQSIERLPCNPRTLASGLGVHNGAGFPVDTQPAPSIMRLMMHACRVVFSPGPEWCIFQSGMAGSAMGQTLYGGARTAGLPKHRSGPTAMWR